LHLLELAVEADPSGRVHAINEQDAVQVIGLVLRGAGQQPGAFENDFLSVEFLGADRHSFGAADVGVDVRDAEATFGPDLFPFVVANLGINEHQRH